MVNEIVLAIDPALRKIEDILLWKNKFKTVAIFTFFHMLFWLFQNYNIRTYCIISCLCLLIHLLDAYRAKKRRELIRLHTSNKNIIESISSLGRWIIYSYNKICQVTSSLRRLKQRNKYKYFIVMLLFWSTTAIIGIKIKGLHLALIVYWFMFIVPAIIHYDIPRKVLSKAMPILEQLDQSMKYERRSILDKKELLVDVKLPSSEFDDLEQEDEYLKSFQLDDVVEQENTVASRYKVYSREPEDEDDDEEDEEDEDDEEEHDEDEEAESDDDEDVEIEEVIEYETKRPVSKEPVQISGEFKRLTSFNQQLQPQKSKNETRVTYDINIDDDDEDLNSLLPDGSLPNIHDVSTSLVQSPSNNVTDKYEESEVLSLVKNVKVMRRKVKNRPSLQDYYGDAIKVDHVAHEETATKQLKQPSPLREPPPPPQHHSRPTSSQSHTSWKYSTHSPVSSSSLSSLHAKTDNLTGSTNKMMLYTSSLVNDNMNSSSKLSRRSTHNEQDIDETFDFLDEELNKYGSN